MPRAARSVSCLPLLHNSRKAASHTLETDVVVLSSVAPQQSEREVPLP